MQPRQWVDLQTVGSTDWVGKTIAIVGGGPSLAGFDFERLRQRAFVLAVNASVFDLPWADAAFSLDRRAMRNWWPRYLECGVPLCFAIPDNWLVNFCAAPTGNMRFVRRATGSAFTLSRWHISCGGSSGYGALQLAFKRGARRIVLLGFDYGASPSGQWHHNERHYSFFQRHDAEQWRQFAAAFDEAAPVLREAGAEVLNASPHSTISGFPRVSIDEAMEWIGSGLR